MYYDCIYLATVKDGADFERTLAERAFTNRYFAEVWGEHKRHEWMIWKVIDGETDLTFIEAVNWSVRAILASFNGRFAQSNALEAETI